MKKSKLYSEVTYSINGFVYKRTCRKCNLIETLSKLDAKIKLFNESGYFGNSIMNVELSK